MNWFKWCKLVGLGSVLMTTTGTCLPDNFWPAFLGDTIISGAASIVVDTVVSGALGQ